MSKGCFLCSLVVLQVCIVQLSLISSGQLTGSQIGDSFLCQDPIWRSRLMPSHGCDEVASRTADSISVDEEIADEGADTGDEYASDDGGVPLERGEAAVDEDDGLQPLEEGGIDDDSDRGKDSSGSGGGGDVECPECRKLFKNDKSMFGHLRSHPNRGYKGATPPAKTLKLSPSHSSSLPGTNQDPQLTPLDILCAYVMLTLKYRDDSPARQQPQPSPPSFENIDAILQPQGGIAGSVTGNHTAEIKSNVCAKATNLQCCDEGGGSIVKITKKRRNIPKEASEALRKKVKLVPTPKEKRPYICKHCKEEFPTHQALGGHMAGHHREKKVPRLNDSLFRAHQGMASQSLNGKQQVKGGGGDGNGRHDNSPSLQRGLHSEQFPMALDVPWQSRKASEGQMRQHLERRNDGLSPAVAAPNPTLADDRDGRRLLNIDLNVEALEQE
ncbi:hypothetical protein BS78_10G126700 [Paspalum vaginatum]|nr:hypothetical protein BS78_10G126700 [Paspalum vaginatum]